MDGQHLAGKIPGEGQGRRRLSRHRPGREVPAERLRPLRHVGQRLAMVQRLVSAGLLRTLASRRAWRAIRKARTRPSIRLSLTRRSASTAAARSSAPTNTARATSSAPRQRRSQHRDQPSGFRLRERRRQAKPPASYALRLTIAIAQRGPLNAQSFVGVLKGVTAVLKFR